jgi:hypothetical protein
MVKKKHGKPRERTERRFVPRSTVNAWVIYVVGAVGALLLGAGIWGQFGNALRKIEVEPYEYAPWVLFAGAVLTGLAIWIATSTEAAIRVGVAGIAEERGQPRRMPWWRVDDVSGDATMIVVRGKDEAGTDMTIRITRRALPDALGWVLREAQNRAGDRVELADDAIAAIGKPSKDAGEIIPAPPLQVVGQRCAESDTIISYEPDARVCPKCERVYHKEHVPKRCVSCDASLADLQDEAKPDEKAPEPAPQATSSAAEDESKA